MLKLEDLKNSKFELDSISVSKIVGGVEEQSMEYYWTDSCSDNSCGESTQDERAWDSCSSIAGPGVGVSIGTSFG